MSEHGLSETSSVLTATATFTSTIPGLGATSGKAIKRLGSIVVYGVDAILIRRRLAQIEGILTHKRLEKLSGESRKYLYNDLLELSRPLYSLTLCTRAFRLIMGEVGGMEFEDLAAAVVDWDVSLSYDLLNAIMFCLLQSEGSLEGSSASSTLPARYYAAGLDAYKTRLPYGSGDSSKSGLCIAFLMFMGLAISLSRSPAFSRLVAIELDLVTFMIRIYPSFLKPKKPWSRELLRAELVLIALLNKLDPVNDYLPIARLNKVLSLTKTKDVASPSSNGLSTTLGSDALASIRSSIAYLQHTNHRMGLAEAILGQNSHSRIPSYSHLDSVYGEILELSRPAYNLSIRTRAFCLIMRDVGGMEFHEIAPAIANWPLSDLFGLLEAMLLCLKTEGNKIDIYRADKGSARLDTYHGAGLEAYIDAYDTQPRFARPKRRWPHCSAFLLLLGLAISLSPNPGFSRMIVELDILTFISESYPHILTPEVPPQDLLPAQHVLGALLQELDPVKDMQPVTQIHKILAIHPNYTYYRINDWLNSTLL